MINVCTLNCKIHEKTNPIPIKVETVDGNLARQQIEHFVLEHCKDYLNTIQELLCDLKNNEVLVLHVDRDYEVQSCCFGAVVARYDNTLYSNSTSNLRGDIEEGVYPLLDLLSAFYLKHSIGFQGEVDDYFEYGIKDKNRLKEIYFQQNRCEIKEFKTLEEADAYMPG